MPIVFENQPKDLVMFPVEYAEAKYTGVLYGKYAADSGVYVVVMDKIRNGLEHRFGPIGWMAEPASPPPADSGNDLRGTYEGDRVRFRHNGRELNVQLYSAFDDLTSRNAGILQRDVMERKRVAAIGAGSVGSKMALEMARSGVKHFLLIDNDMVEVHSIARSEYTWEDVGDYKTAALARKIRSIRPDAEIRTENRMVEDVPKDVWDAFMEPGQTIVFSGADNRSASAYGNDLAMMYNVPFLSVGCWERCFAAEIFFWIPGMELPCYRGAVGDDDRRSGGTGGVASVSRRLYVTDERKAVFQPGLSVDITASVSKAVMLAIDILNLDTEGYHFKLLGDVSSYSCFFNTKNAAAAGSQKELAEWLLRKTRGDHCNFKPVSCAECDMQATCAFRS